MKRSVFIFLIIIVALMLVSCSGSSSFEINGKWKNTGSEGFGQAQPGSIIIFDEKNCNFYSPSDTYAFYKDNGRYVLDITSLLFGENMSFTVDVKDKDNIEITNGRWVVKLTRVQ